MPTDTEDSGFLSRWSRRKTLVRQGTALDERPAPPVAVATVPSAAVPALAPNTPPHAEGTAARDQAAPREATPTAPSPTAAPAEPAPTLADVAALTRDSDYSRFVGRSVQPDVKNAALAKLFTDPHFNVMDGLDTYIDDYSKPDPLPPGMLRQMLQSHVLGLFDDEDPAAKTGPAAPDLPAAPTATAPTPPACDENTDLQLQPDDDAGCTGAATGPEENTRHAH